MKESAEEHLELLLWAAGDGPAHLRWTGRAPSAAAWGKALPHAQAAGGATARASSSCPHSTLLPRLALQQLQCLPPAPRGSM